MIHVGKIGGKRFEIPDDFVTQVAAVLARRGTGKTYTAKILAEGLLDAKQQVIALDPTDVWWGLRISEKGTPAYDIVVFGGEHGDVPLVEASAEPLARLLATQAINAIISLDHLSKSGQRRFVTTFLETFYAAKTPSQYRTPVHLFIDEADMFAPQRVQKGSERMLGAVDTIVRRGRTRGFGVTMITQRPATLHKDVLTQAEVLIAKQIIAPQDRKAVGEWISMHGEGMGYDPAEILAKLARFEMVQAILWSPGWLGAMFEIEVRKAKTFDSSSTPDGKALAKVKAPKIDLEAINAAMAVAIEEAKENDPKELKREIAQLKKELAKQRQAEAEVVVREPDDIEERIQRAYYRGVGDCNEAWGKHAAAFAEGPETPSLPPELLRASPRPSRKAPVKRLVDQPSQKVGNPRAPAATTPSSSKLPKGVCKFLSVLSAHGECSMSKLSLLAGYSPKSSTVRNILSSCRNWEGGPLLHGSGKGPFVITDVGVAALGIDAEDLPTGDALIQWWSDQLGTNSAPRAIFDALAAAYPDSLDKHQLEERTGYSASSSTIRNAFSRLRTLGLMTNDGQAFRASDDLFEG